MTLKRDRLGFHLAEDSLERLRPLADADGQTVGPKVGGLAQLLSFADARCESCQRFDQRQPQQQRERPDLGDCERLDSLILTKALDNIGFVQRMVGLAY